MKRLFDIIASGLGLVVLSPLFLIIAIWIKLDSKGPVFYRQVRVGRNNKDFRIFKFRSMRVDKNADEKNFKADEGTKYAIIMISIVIVCPRLSI